jgi:hypothetical protein
VISLSLSLSLPATSVYLGGGDGDGDSDDDMSWCSVGDGGRRDTWKRPKRPKLNVGMVKMSLCRWQIFGQN